VELTVRVFTGVGIGPSVWQDTQETEPALWIEVDQLLYAWLGYKPAGLWQPLQSRAM
jgi:hypothetical protein